MIRIFLTFSFLVSSIAFAKESSPNCKIDLLLPSTTNVILPVAGNNKTFLFHNHQIAQSLNAHGFNHSSLRTIINDLIKAGTFSIPTNNNGFVTAADVGDHPGNYGRYFWLRDLARVYAGTTASVRLMTSMGLNAHEAQKIQHQRALALVKILGDPWWSHQAEANILDPGMHLDPAKIQLSSIWVRRLAAPFLEDRLPTAQELANEADWGHRQNDAIATFALTIIDAISNGDLRDEEISYQVRRNLMLTAQYFVRLEYWKMWDMGAWEEQLALRTHSVGLVTSFLEKFLRIFKNDRSVDAPAMQNAIHQAYTLLERRYGMTDSRARIVESEQGIPGSSRFEDTAIIHGLWWPLHDLDSEDYLKIIRGLNSLKRNSGYTRYQNDWFLYGPAEVAAHAQKMGLVGHMTLLENGSRRIAKEWEIDYLAFLHDQHRNDKDMRDITTMTGTGLEAQWTLPDAILASYFADLYMTTKRVRYLEKAKEHYVRLLGLVTGESDVSSEGQLMPANRLPEAYLPVPLQIDGKHMSVYFTSPNSPLNWATAEFTVATEKILRAMKTP